MSTISMERVLRTQILPWTQNTGEERLIVARRKMLQSSLPHGVKLTARPIKGQRIVRKDRRIHANQRLHIADWPAANLHEIAVPKLACVVEGEVDYLLTDYNVRCGPGNFILIPPRVPHQRTGPFYDPAEKIPRKYMLFQAYAYSHGVQCWFSGMGNGKILTDNYDHYLVLSASASLIMNLLSEEAAAAEDGFSTACAGMLSALFVILSREIAAGRYTHPGPAARQKIVVTDDASFADQLRKYLEMNCYKPLKLEDGAAYFYMSVSQFTRRVRRETGKTFNAMLVEVRLQRAKALLRESDWTVTIISSHLSFKSPSYFAALFKERVGCTPGEYRHRP